MLSIVLYPIRLLCTAVLSHDTPRQVALGVMLGMMLGLLPKGNLVAFGLGTLLLATRVNVAAGLLAACGFSWLAPIWDQTAHRLGEKVLGWPPAQDAFAYLIELPLLPWSGLNNTVVVGQLLIGLYIAYPVYLMAELVVRTTQPRIVARLEKYRVSKLLFGLDAVGRVEGE